MKTRLARQLDIFSLRQLLKGGSMVIQPSALDDDHGPLTSAFLPGGGRSWVAEDDSGVVGFAHARPRRYVLGWELVRVQVKSDRDADAVVAILVQEILQYLQDRGIPRLFARTSEDSSGQAVLVACGFTHLSSETILVREPKMSRPPQETPVGMRYRMPQDAWPLRQLENTQTPLLISQLEGLTSSSWSMPKPQLFRGHEPNELVVERDGEIVGWVGWSIAGATSCHREHIRLGVMVGMYHAEVAAPLLDYALYASGSKRPHAEVVVRLRDYQSAIVAVLVEREFTQIARDSLFIKHGRLQAVAKRMSKLFELAPTVHAFTLEPISK